MIQTVGGVGMSVYLQEQEGTLSGVQLVRPGMLGEKSYSLSSWPQWSEYRTAGRFRALAGCPVGERVTPSALGMAG